jgi:FMN phosphatase YigB (HAD superfamily)
MDAVGLYSIKTISDLSRYIDNQTILFFDIDDTLIRNKTHLGSNQWEDSLVSLMIKNGVDDNIAFKKAKFLWCAFQVVSEVEVVEPSTLEFFNKLLQSHHLRLITARPAVLANETFQQLASVGIKTNVTDKFLINLNKENHVLYENGIFFCDSCNKGAVIADYMNRYSLNPGKIVLVDDRLHHLEKAAMALKAFNFIGLHYNYLSEYINNLNIDPASRLLNESLSNPKSLKLFLNGLLL